MAPSFSPTANPTSTSQRKVSITIIETLISLFHKWNPRFFNYKIKNYWALKLSYKQIPITNYSRWNGSKPQASRIARRSSLINSKETAHSDQEFLERTTINYWAQKSFLQAISYGELQRTNRSRPQESWVARRSSPIKNSYNEPQKRWPANLQESCVARRSTWNANDSYNHNPWATYHQQFTSDGRNIGRRRIEPWGWVGTRGSRRIRCRSHHSEIPRRKIGKGAEKSGEEKHWKTLGGAFLSMEIKILVSAPPNQITPAGPPSSTNLHRI